MSVSVMFPPETVWGYDTVTAAYRESPHASWKRIVERVREVFPSSSMEDLIQVVGKEPD